jgi:hypothetical protein
MAYFSEAELEARTGKVFSVTSLLTSTQIGTMATEISALFDGLMDQTEGTETPSERIKQACLSCAHYTVDQIYAGEPVDPEKQIRILRNFLGPTGHTSSFYYSQDYPESTGDWS